MSPQSELWAGQEKPETGSGTDTDFEYCSASETGSESDSGGEGTAEVARELEELAGDDMTDEVDAVEEQIWEYDLDPSSLNDNFDDYDADDLYNGNLHPPEFYHQAMKQLDENDYARKEYAPSTEGIISMAESSWRTFCKDVLGDSDWQGALRRIDFSVVYCFLHWHLSQRTGKNGRSKRRITKTTSLTTFWCVFRLVFERVTTFKIDKLVDCRKVANGLVQLQIKYKLTSERRENRSMTLADLKLQIHTTLQTTEKCFRLGELRILAVLFLLLLAPAGSRPASILQVRFGDIRVVLARDPQGGPHNLLIKFTLKFTKQYLGKKAIKTFIIPEIIYDDCLLLSPHVFLLGILFRHRAFRAENLNDNPHKLAELDIHEGETELQLPLKKKLHDVLVFRRARQDPVKGLIMSRDGISRGMMNSWVRRIGELSGFEHNTICYSLRYMAGNNMDRSVDVSEALRNLVMDHAPNSDTFQERYLNRIVCADLWAIHRNSNPQQALIQQASSHGHSRSSRRPVQLTLQQAAGVNLNPKVIQLTEKLRNTPKKTPQYNQIRLQLKAAKARWFHAAKTSLRKEWTDKQAVDDVERQIRGDGIAQIPKKQATEMNASQKRVIQTLTAPFTRNLEEQFRRRDEAVSSIANYCRVEEPLRTKVVAKPDLPLELQSSRAVALLKESVTVTAAGQRRKRCFICVGKALRLPTDDDNIAELCRNFYTESETARHFRRVHLKHLGEQERTRCPICLPKVTLKNKMHLQNHAQKVHGIRSSAK